MDLPDLIRNKRFHNELKFDLLEIAWRGNANVIEGLLDYINEKLGDLTYIHELEHTIEERDIELRSFEIAKDALRSEIERLRTSNTLRATKFEDLIKTFREQEQRYPSIDEVWKASWEACLDAIRNNKISGC